MRLPQGALWKASHLQWMITNIHFEFPAKDSETQSIVKWAIPGLHAVSTRHKIAWPQPIAGFSKKVLKQSKSIFQNAGEYIQPRALNRPTEQRVQDMK